MFCELYHRKTTISLATHMQTHRRTISSGRIQTYRIKTICLLLSPPATRTHEGVRVFGWVRECLGLLKSACSDSPSKVNVPIHNSYAPLNGTYPRLDGFALFFRHLSERDNSYSIRCANVGRLLATFLSSAFSSCCRAAGRAPTAIITGGLFGGI